MKQLNQNGKYFCFHSQVEYTNASEVENYLLLLLLWAEPGHCWWEVIKIKIKFKTSIQSDVLCKFLFFGFNLYRYFWFGLTKFEQNLWSQGISFLHYNISILPIIPSFQLVCQKHYDFLVWKKGLKNRRNEDFLRIIFSILCSGRWGNFFAISVEIWNEDICDYAVISLYIFTLKGQCPVVLAHLYFVLLCI